MLNNGDMTCEEVKKLLPDFVKGRAVEEEREMIKSHLISCIDCRVEEGGLLISMMLNNKDMTCEEVKKLLPDFVKGAVLKEEYEMIKSHLINCDDCWRAEGSPRISIEIVHSSKKYPNKKPM